MHQILLMLHHMYTHSLKSVLHPWFGSSLALRSIMTHCITKSITISKRHVHSPQWWKMLAADPRLSGANTEHIVLFYDKTPWKVQLDTCWLPKRVHDNTKTYQVEKHPTCVSIPVMYFWKEFVGYISGETFFGWYIWATISFCLVAFCLVL